MRMSYALSIAAALAAVGAVSMDAASARTSDRQPGSPVVRDHRPAPVIRDHRTPTRTIVRDHRTPTTGSKSATGSKVYPRTVTGGKRVIRPGRLYGKVQDRTQVIVDGKRVPRPN
jgi:hypothetical protein